MNEKLQQAIEHWDAVAPLIQRPESERDYESLVSQLEEAMVLSSDDHQSPLNPLIESMAHAAQQYEEKFLVNEVGGGVSALKYLMKVHKIKQSVKRKQKRRRRSMGIFQRKLQTLHNTSILPIR